MKKAPTLGDECHTNLRNCFSRPSTQNQKVRLGPFSDFLCINLIGRGRSATGDVYVSAHPRPTRATYSFAVRGTLSMGDGWSLVRAVLGCCQLLRVRLFTSSNITVQEVSPLLILQVKPQARDVSKHRQSEQVIYIYFCVDAT